LSKKEKVLWNKKLKKLTDDSQKLETEIEEIKNNKIYENAFEWRFEFPEVLDDNGDFVGFDVVIGNPPYVSLPDITGNFRRFYEKIYKTATGRFDLYSLFIEKAMQVKKPTGVFAFIVPGKFLNNKQFVMARKIICDKHGVTVVKIDDKVFEDAQVDSAIVENYFSSNAKYKTLHISGKAIQKLSETNVASILQGKEIIFRLEINAKIDNLISKIETDSLRVKEIGEVKDGIIAGRIKELLFLDEKLDNDSYKLYFGKNVTRFHLDISNIWVNYKKAIMMGEEMKRVGNTGPGLRMRDEKIFKREKIIYRKVGKEIIATFDSNGIYYEQTIHSCHITDERFKTKYVLGLFNSTLFKFYYRKTNSQGGDIFPQVRISSIEDLPIKLTDIKSQEKIEKLVDRILAIKEKNTTVDVTKLENKIDELVYKLYYLTKEEIEIVESSVK
ncbi:MAG TPA: class I SAM-dependent DNA methyltransferase, partial [Ignavibacteria bacterium]|nr:class I SAM-dependent DNA methyltransferase [Ignavibacteria bacterium]